MTPRGLVLTLLLLPATPALAFDIRGVALGGRERDIRKAFPAAHCRALEWRSTAAERRCDDSRIALAGVRASVTFYLKADAIEAFSVRFNGDDLERVREHLRAAWGAPRGEVVERVSRQGRDGREVVKMRWEKGAAQAVLTSQVGRKRAEVEAWRGNFDSEIYRVR